MRAALLTDKETHMIIDAKMPVIGDEEVLIKVKVCGYCASELSAWVNGRYAENDYMGHEVVGVIEAIGSRVTGLEIGNRVTGYILNGFAEYTKAHYSLVTVVPDGLSDEEAIGEPLGCLVSGASRTPVSYGDRVGVIGLGYMGLGFMQLMKIKGASEVTVFDVREEAMENARRFGADDCCLALDVPDSMKVTTYGINMDGGFDVVAEVSGSQPGLTLAGEITGVHKTMSVVGFHQNGPREVNMELWNWKAFDMINAHERRDEVMMQSIRQGLRLIRAGQLNTQDLMTHRFELEDIDEGFRALKEKPDGYIKGYVVMEKQPRT